MITYIQKALPAKYLLANQKVCWAQKYSQARHVSWLLYFFYNNFLQYLVVRNRPPQTLSLTLFLSEEIN